MPADTGRSDTGQGGIAAVIAVLKKRVGWIFLLFAGVLLPLLLKRMNIDPAVAGTVVVTAVTDVIGFFSFLGLATLILMH